MKLFPTIFFSSASTRLLSIAALFHSFNLRNYYSTFLIQLLVFLLVLFRRIFHARLSLAFYLASFFVHGLTIAIFEFSVLLHIQSNSSRSLYSSYTSLLRPILQYIFSCTGRYNGHRIFISKTPNISSILLLVP